MSNEFNMDQRFHPGWDSQDTTGLEDHADAHDTETGAVLGVVSGAVIGALAGGPVGAVVGSVLGGIGAGAGVAAVEKHEHNYERNEFDRISTSPYPGDAGRPDVVQLNGTGLYSTSSDIDAAGHGRTGSPSSTYTEAIPREDWCDEAGESNVFHLHGYPDAEQASVAGTFNNWSSTANPMRYLDGVWITEINLPPGRHLYRFVVDGSWIIDPHNPDNEEKGDGVNSVIEI